MGDGGTGGSRSAAPSAGAVLSAGVPGLAPSGATAPARSVAWPVTSGAPSGATLGAGAVPGTAPARPA